MKENTARIERMQIQTGTARPASALQKIEQPSEFDFFYTSYIIIMIFNLVIILLYF